MQHGIPVGDMGIIGTDLTENFGGVDEQQDNDFQRVGQINAQLPFQQRRQGEQDQRQDTEKDVLIVAVDKLGNENADDRQPEKNVQSRHPSAMGPNALASSGQSNPSFW